MIKGEDFITDGDKLVDLFTLSKEEFLKSYSYLIEDDYDQTIAKIKKFLNKQEDITVGDYAYTHTETTSQSVFLPDSHFIGIKGIGIRRGDINYISKMGGNKTLINYRHRTGAGYGVIELDAKFEDVLKLINSGVSV